MLPKHLTMLNNILPISNMQYSTVISRHPLHHPRYLSGTDPLTSLLQFAITTNVDQIYRLLDISYGGHLLYLAVVLEVEPGEHCLE